jgi:hypothetical protein
MINAVNENMLEGCMYIKIGSSIRNINFQCLIFCINVENISMNRSTEKKLGTTQKKP